MNSLIEKFHSARWVFCKIFENKWDNLIRNQVAVEGNGILTSIDGHDILVMQNYKCLICFKLLKLSDNPQLWEKSLSHKLQNYDINILNNYGWYCRHCSINSLQEQDKDNFLVDERVSKRRRITDEKIEKMLK